MGGLGTIAMATKSFSNVLSSKACFVQAKKIVGSRALTNHIISYVEVRRCNESIVNKLRHTI